MYDSYYIEIIISSINFKDEYSPLHIHRSSHCPLFSSILCFDPFLFLPPSPSFVSRIPQSRCCPMYTVAKGKTNEKYFRVRPLKLWNSFDAIHTRKAEIPSVPAEWPGMSLYTNTNESDGGKGRGGVWAGTR